MTVELALVATGAGSMLAAALAGSRRVARTARLGVVYVGLLCVVAGLALRGGATGSAAPVVSTTIAAQLAPDELSEEVRVFIDGRDVGRLRVDERTPQSRLRVTVAGTGRHRYRLRSRRQVKGRRPETARREGRVAVDGKHALGIVYSLEGEVFLTAS